MYMRRMNLRKKRDFACEGLSHSGIMAFTATRSNVTERRNWACETLPSAPQPSLVHCNYHFT
jgi:hypothetical protein